MPKKKKMTTTSPSTHARNVKANLEAKKAKKAKKDSFQRTVAESTRTRKKTRGEAITGETMKLHGEAAKEDELGRKASARAKKLKAGGRQSYGALTDTMLHMHKEYELRDEAKSLAKRRSPSATVGKAGKEMETRRRKKKDD